MRWRSDWWGIELLADTNEDKEMLKKLLEALPQDAFEHYEDGELQHELDEQGRIELIRFIR